MRRIATKRCTDREHYVPSAEAAGQEICGLGRNGVGSFSGMPVGENEPTPFTQGTNKDDHREKSTDAVCLSGEAGWAKISGRAAALGTKASIWAAASGRPGTGAPR